MLLQNILQVDVFTNALVPPVASIITFAVLVAIIWNVSRRYTTLELDVKNMKELYHADILRIQTQHLEDVKALEVEIQRQAVERKDDISESSLKHKDELNNMQKQLERTNADVKSLLSKIEVNETNIKTSQDVHTELRTEDRRLIDFFKEWNQRIEDRIEKAEDRIEAAKRDIMGFMNMLLTKEGQQKSGSR